MILLITIVFSYLVDVTLTHRNKEISNDRFKLHESGKIKNGALNQITVCNSYCIICTKTISIVTYNGAKYLTAFLTLQMLLQTNHCSLTTNIFFFQKEKDTLDTIGLSIHWKNIQRGTPSD